MRCYITQIAVYHSHHTHGCLLIASLEISSITLCCVVAAALLASNHKVYISVGHDEYWSGPQRQHVEAARDKGLSLAFLSGNEVFWRVRWEADATNSSHRIVVSYKDTQSQTKLDPVPGEWTGTWRDGRSINPVGAHPENELTGTIYTVNAWRNDFLEVPAKYSDHRQENLMLCMVLPVWLSVAHICVHSLLYPPVPSCTLTQSLSRKLEFRECVFV